MVLNELTNVQVADAYIDQDRQQRRVDANKTEQQLARERALQYDAEKKSKDPLKLRIAQLRQQLAVLIQQDRKNTEAGSKTGTPEPTQSTIPPGQSAAPNPAGV